MNYNYWWEAGNYCYVSLEYEEMRTYGLGYCKNRYLNLAIIEIGKKTFGYRQNMSAYKRGINFICSMYEQINNERLYKAELKRLVRPNKKQMHCLKIPIKAKKILECVAYCTHHFCDCKNKCYSRNERFCNSKGRFLLRPCLRYLAYEMHTTLSIVRLDPRSDIYNIYSDLINHKKRCSL